MNIEYLVDTDMLRLLANHRTKDELIEYTHQIRERFLHAIQMGDQQAVNHLMKISDQIITKDVLDISKRIPSNKLRSMKNFYLSHNTLYSYHAEKGGLSAAQSHYLSEKYAIMIEHTDTLSGLEEVHINMLNEYVNKDIRYSNKKSYTIVDKVVFFIEKNFSEQLTIKEIADRLFVHPSHIMRSFKKEKGMTISEFRNLKRIHEAKQLLHHSRLPMIEIAFIVGFTNSQYFSRIFKSEVGITPSAFRERKKR